MTRPTAAPLEILLSALALLLLWAVVATSPAMLSGLSAVAVILTVLAFVPDFVDLVLRVAARRLLVQSADMGLAPAPSIGLDVGTFTPYQKRLHVRPYAIVVSVRNLERGMGEFLETVEPFKERLWVIDDQSSDLTVALLAQAGLRCHRSTVNRRKPGAIRELLERLPASIETVLVIDPDTRYEGGAADLEPLIFDFQQSRAEAFTPRVDVRPDGLVASLQRLEYFLALSIGRKSMADCAANSGVSIYRRQALAAALDRHSLSVYAEDLETSLILLGDGGRIYYDDRARFETEGKRTWSALFSQRVGWSFGLARAYTTRFREVLRIARRGPLAAYQYVAYLGVLGLLFQPIRSLALPVMLLSLLNGVGQLAGLDFLPAWSWTHPNLFVVMYTQYFLLALLALRVGVPPEARLGLLPITVLYPFYILFLIVPVTLGYLNWVTTRLVGRRLYNDHFQDEASLQGSINGDATVLHLEGGGA